MKNQNSPKSENNSKIYGNILDRYINGIKTDKLIQQEALRVEFMHKNFNVGYLDIIFPYHMRLLKGVDTRKYTF